MHALPLVWVTCKIIIDKPKKGGDGGGGNFGWMQTMERFIVA